MRDRKNVDAEVASARKPAQRKTRLEAMFDRVLAQCTLIDYAAELVVKIPGPVLEVGLGNGRTYDHLCDRFRGREIFAFDRELASDPRSRPDKSRFIQGDFLETLPEALVRIGAKAAVAHCDIGSHDSEASRTLGAVVAHLLAPLVAHQGVVLGDQPMVHPDFEALPLPDNLEPESYFIYRVR